MPVVAFNREKALIGAFSVIVKLREGLFTALTRARSASPGVTAMLQTLAPEAETGGGQERQWGTAASARRDTGRLWLLGLLGSWVRATLPGGTRV